MVQHFGQYTPWKAFICYETSTGLDFADHLKRTLENKAGVATFVAEVDLQRGPAWRPTIDAAIDNCSYFIVLGTILALGSQQVIRELRRAEGKNKSIIPCRHRDIARNNFLALFSGEERQELLFETKEELARQVLKDVLRDEQKLVTAPYVSEAATSVLGSPFVSDEQFLVKLQQRLDTGTVNELLSEVEAWLEKKGRAARSALSLLSRAHLLQAFGQFERGEYGDSRRIFLLALEEAGKAHETDLQVAASIGAGASSGNLGYHQEAISLFDLRLSLRPGTAGDFYNRGTAFGKKGDLDAAIADFDQALQLDPNFPSTYLNRGYAYLLKKEYESSVRDFDRYLAFRPDDPIAYRKRAEAYAQGGKYTEAISDFTTSLQLEPDVAVTYNDRGCAYAMRGDYDRAFDDFSKTIGLDPNNVLAYGNRGNIFEFRGEPRRAIEDFDRALSINPTYVPALVGRSLLYLHRRAYDRAIHDLDRAIELAPNTALAYFNRGNCYLGKRQYDKAVADFDRTMALVPTFGAASEQREIANSLRLGLWVPPKTKRIWTPGRNVPLKFLSRLDQET